MNLKHFIFSIFLFQTVQLFGQEKIDANVSITFPQKPKTQEFSENVENIKANLKAFYLNTQEQSLIAVRSVLLENGKEINKPASSSLELKEIYDSEIKTQINAMKNKGFFFLDSMKIDIQTLTGYRLKYTLADTKEQGAESIILFLNGIRDVFTYSKVSTYNEYDKTKFLNSISVNNPQVTSQVEPIQKKAINWLKYGLYAISLFGFIIYFSQATKKQSKNGINLKTIYCPNCNTKQPFLRLPKNISQTLYGGIICPKCGKELDKYGNIIT